MKIYLLIALNIFIFNACSFNNSNCGKYVGTDFKLISHKLSSPLCSKIEKSSVLYMTEFVNEKNLKNASQLGFLLSNELKVSLLQENCTKNVSFKSFQLANVLFKNKEGTKILTRNMKHTKTKKIKENKKVLAGTYIITQKQLLLFVKLINLESGNIISSTSTSTPINNEIKDLEGINTKKPELTINKPFHL